MSLAGISEESAHLRFRIQAISNTNLQLRNDFTLCFLCLHQMKYFRNQSGWHPRIFVRNKPY
jgi:hypothetical protein